MSYKTYCGNESTFYEADPEAVEIVNFAVQLGRPILVEGEAGCGKTSLAKSIAAELGLGEPTVMTVKSSFQAKDLLYRFNALRRLQDIQDPTRRDEAQYISPYISLQPLGLAIASGKPGVVLIDEIDKADMDFPNDLLDVLGAFAFDIEEIPSNEASKCLELNGFGRRVQSPDATRPIVVITSNREKQLPEPFLRRCLYINLKFPENPEVLASIVRKNLALDPGQLSADLLESAVKTFLDIRRKALESGAQKPPATSELIDWVQVLLWQGNDAESLRASRAPHWKILFKTLQDVAAYAARTPASSSASVAPPAEGAS
jgi:MoxR-like ATPase